MASQKSVVRQARVNITWKGQNTDLPDMIDESTTDPDVKAAATAAVAGGLPGIDADAGANFGDFVVDRFDATAGLPARIMIRPRTPFG